MSTEELGFRPIERYEIRGKKVLVRLDINSPIDPQSKRIVNDNRIRKSLPTLRQLIEGGAKVAVIAHQGDTLDYQNLIPLREHAQLLGKLLGQQVSYIDDVCGPMAQAAVEGLDAGDVIILGNLRYLSEEISSFEDVVKLRADQMLDTWLVRSLAPLFDLYVNDAFAAAHRNAPSMVAFQQLLPSAAGPLFFHEMTTLSHVRNHPAHPCTFVLGGAKISDAFSMMEQVLSNGTADTILTSGLTGEVFLLARGMDLGRPVAELIEHKGLTRYIEEARELLERYGKKIRMPEDLAYGSEGVRQEILIEALPADQLFMDIGSKTIESYRKEIAQAGTVFVNGPAGVFEDPLFAQGTKELWQAIEQAEGYTVVGGGDSVSAAARFTDPSRMDYICTAGGAMVRYLSGRPLPLIEAMEEAERRERNL
ncbi:MAG: phosphoglycerate kinase [Spirochaetia bacterium]|nr:phosphoglycerate kinase [Spirochaetia bacterium]